MNTATKDMYSGLVLLFNTCADSSRAARLHATSCPMVNTSKGGGKVKASTDTAEIAIEVADLEGRGFPVKRCKCCRRGP